MKVKNMKAKALDTLNFHANVRGGQQHSHASTCPSTDYTQHVHQDRRKPFESTRHTQAWLV